MSRKTKRTIRTVLITLGALLVLLEGALSMLGLSFDRPITTETAVHFIDVGQGDASLLLSGGQAVLIDAGETSAGETVIDYLEALGVTRLYAVVATHPHADHIGGMAKVIEAFPIDNFYMGPETANTKTYERMLDALNEQNIRPIVPQSGEELAFESGAAITFLGPADDVPADDLNNRSIVCLFRAGDQRVLLMGDAEGIAEASLLKHHPFLSCEVLKVGHHGSDTSSTKYFLNRIRPDTAVISCGRDNDYGHPSPDTMLRLTEANIKDVRITAEQGSVIIQLDQPSDSKENAA